MQVPKKSFVFAPRFNQPPDHANPHGNDATGAFHPGLEQYRSLYEGLGGQVVTLLFDNHAPAARRRSEIIDAMQRRVGTDRYDAIVYFGHGWHGGLASAGFNVASLDELATALRTYAKPSAKVVLYACSCAAPGGYAYKLAQRLVGFANNGFEIFGHPIEGHSFRNPMVRRYPSNRGEEGETVCPAGHFASWAETMRTGRDHYWAKMPFMTMAERAAAL